MKFKIVSAFVFSMTTLMSGACAHREISPETVAVVEPAPVAPSKPVARTKIEYVYVETPSTVSAMTTAPFERTSAGPGSFGSKVLNIFWPLLTMMATGLVFILVLLVENRVLNKQLAKRTELKARLQAI